MVLELERQLRNGAAPPTVTSVVQGARVSRSAFYRHFASLEELGAAAIRRAPDDLRPPRRLEASSPAGGNDTRLSYGDFFEHISAHRHLYASLITGQDEPARDELYRALVEQIQQAVEAAAARPRGTSSRRAATFVAGGVMASVSDWLAGAEDGSPQDLAAAVIALMPPWFADDAAGSYAHGGRPRCSPRQRQTWARPELSAETMGGPVSVPTIDRDRGHRAGSAQSGGSGSCYPSSEQYYRFL